MKKVEIERTIKVNVIKFDNGSEIDLNIIRKFIDEVYVNFEDTIGKEGNYTSDYFYMQTIDEKKLEPILLELDVIRKSPAHKIHNERVGVTYSYDNYFYWLSDGYHKFVEEVYKLL